MRRCVLCINITAASLTHSLTPLPTACPACLPACVFHTSSASLPPTLLACPYSFPSSLPPFRVSVLLPCVAHFLSPCFLTCCFISSRSFPFSLLYLATASFPFSFAHFLLPHVACFLFASLYSLLTCFSHDLNPRFANFLPPCLSYYLCSTYLATCFPSLSLSLPPLPCLFHSPTALLSAFLARLLPAFYLPRSLLSSPVPGPPHSNLSPTPLTSCPRT